MLVVLSYSVSNLGPLHVLECLAVCLLPFVSLVLHCDVTVIDYRCNLEVIHASQFLGESIRRVSDVIEFDGIARLAGRYTISYIS